MPLSGIDRDYNNQAIYKDYSNHRGVDLVCGMINELSFEIKDRDEGLLVGGDLRLVINIEITN